jgi:hypothetical protein
MKTSAVRVSVEVRYAAARFRVRVRASSIGRAVGLAKAFRSADDVTAVFPTDREGLLVEDPSAAGGPAGRGKSQA